MGPVARISRVLVGIDFDEASASALQMAGALASASDAEVTVLHSVPRDAPAYFTPGQIETLEAERDQARETTANRVRALAEQQIPRSVHVVVEEAPPTDALLRLAPSFDLILVGTHRRHGARRWWLGSVAEALVRRSPRPVLVVPAGATVPAPGPADTILAAGVSAEAEAWTDVFKRTFGSDVVRFADIHQCAPDRLQDTGLIILSLPDHRATTQFSDIVQVLKECTHPVLFVPGA